MWLCSKRPEDAAASFNRLENRWVIENLAIFAGESSCCRRQHNQIATCDKECPVKPVLGIVADLFLRRERKETLQNNHKTMMELSSIHNEMFPKMFDFLSERGVTRKNRFGTSVKWLVNLLVQNPKIEILQAIEGRAPEVAISRVLCSSLHSVDKAGLGSVARAELSL